MEENSRVRNIKQKFEDINGNEKIKLPSKLPIYKINLPISEDNGDSANDLNCNAASHRANIKRTPAFRRDKALPRACEKPECPKEIKPSIVTNRVNLFNKLQSDESLPKSVDDDASSTKVADLCYNSLPKSDLKMADLGIAYAKVKKPQRCTKPAVKNKKTVDERDPALESRRQPKPKNQTETPKKIENSVNKENVRRYSPGHSANPQIYDELSDTLKRVLRSPLPPGPPPKKPPRTFTAKPINNGPVEERKENIFPIPIPAIPKPVRSKTESEIMLKKIENALRRHQNPTSPQLSVRKVSAPDCRTEKYAMINKNGRKSVDRSSTLGLCKNSKNGTRLGTQAKTQTSQLHRDADSHIYDDPRTVTTNDGSPGNDERLRNSLYYMSTPIDSIVTPSNRPSLTVVEAKNLDVKKPVDVLFSEDPATKIPNDISMENKIKLWMDNAYSQPWVKASDGSSDSDSMMSLNADDMSPTSPVDTAGEEYDQVTLRRKGYVQKMASKVISRQQSVVTPLPSDYKHLFECLLLIGLDLDALNNKVPYIKWKYPRNTEVPQWIEHMCFPDAYDWTNSSTERLNNVKEVVNEERSYVVTLTSQGGQRKYVYCRRIKPEGESASLPLCYCILSPHQAHEFYISILNELENRHGQSDLKFKKFLKELHDHKFPLRGQSVAINSYAEDGFEKIREDLIERPRDFRLEDLRLAKTLSQMKINTFLTIFSSLLLERKVILLSSQISKLSTCMGGLQAALLPFHWQHTLITAVPSNLIPISDLCEAPTPYLIGLLKTKNIENSLPQFTKQQIVVVDLDEKKVIRKVGDENSILPSHLAKGIKSALQLAHSSEPRTNNLLACEAFMRLFVELIGHYRRYVRPISYDSNQRKTFQKEAFVKASSPHSVRMFLEWFLETASFATFIESRLSNGPESKGFFELRCNEYYEELSKSKYTKNKKIVKQIGDFIKDWSI